MVFNAVKTNVGDSYGNLAGDIAFNEVPINVGGGMAQDGSKFITPFSGYYRFSFSGTSGVIVNSITRINVYKNDKIEFNIYDRNDAEKADGNNLSFTWIWSMKKGDTVRFSLKIGYIYAAPFYPVIFTGELIYKEH